MAWSRGGQFILDLVHHPIFDSFYALVVLANSVYIGLEVEHSISGTDEPRPTWMFVIQYVFTILFTMELHDLTASPPDPAWVYQGIWSAVDHFKASPPNVTGGITVLGSTLLQSLNLILTEEGRASWPDYAKFRDFWTKAFEDFDSNFQGIRTDLASFAEEGNVTSLISAVSQVLVQASDMVVDMVPGPLAGTISRALDAVNKAFAAVGEALAEFRDGDTLGGLQALYYGLRNASQGLWSSDDDKDAAFASLVAGLDGIVGGLSEDVLDYQRRLAEGKSCWKVSLARERYLPSICSEGARAWACL
eukprot:s112_g29.t1